MPVAAGRPAGRSAPLAPSEGPKRGPFQLRRTAGDPVDRVARAIACRSDRLSKVRPWQWQCLCRCDWSRCATGQRPDARSVALSGLSVSEELADDWKAKTNSGSVARMGVA
jgi:hypothetical protein